MKNTRLLFCEDNREYRQNLVSYIQQHFGNSVSIESADSPQSGIAAINTFIPDVLITDGFSEKAYDLARHLWKVNPAGSVALLTAGSGDMKELYLACPRDSSYAILHKGFELREIADIIQQVINGDCCIDPEQHWLLMRLFRQNCLVPSLSLNELSVLVMLSVTQSKSSICQLLCIPERTLTVRLESLCRKLGSSESELVSNAFNQGMLDEIWLQKIKKQVANKAANEGVSL